MGQYWELLNIDKRERLKFSSLWKWGEVYLDLSRGAIKCLAPGNYWAGDRIIFLGDYSGSFPPGVLSEEEILELEPDKPDFDEVWGCEPFNWPTEVGKVALRNLNSNEYITDLLFSGMSISCHIGLAVEFC
jgi:hypothetical protein